MTVPNTFPPLQPAIAHAESWRIYLNACQDELRSPHAQDFATRAENSVAIGVQLGELLPITWRAAFHVLFRPNLASWKSVKEFEAFRQEVRALFYTVREALDESRKTAEMLQTLTGRPPVRMDRLLKGPWDEEYFQLRCRIGRVHVRIALPQHYMFGAMNVLRQELNALVDEAFIGKPDELRAVRLAVGKILDLELAIMLHTYREDLLSQQARSERLSTFGQLVGSIGHELRNPLGVIESSLYILKSRMGPDERAKKHADRIGEQLGIANSIITDLLDMIRDKPLVAESVRLRDVAESAAAQLRLAIGLEPLALLPEVRGDPSQLRQVFINLMANAQQAAGPDGTVSLDAEVGDAMVAVGVSDTGPGVDPSVRARLFEPLVTTRQKGIGLGLALVKRIAERHGGSVAYEPRGKGARFVVRLPRSAP